MTQSNIKKDIKAVKDQGELLTLCQSIDLANVKSQLVLRIAQRMKKLGDKPDIKIAYLGNITFEPLPDYVSGYLACMGYCCDAYLAPYDQFMQQLLDEQSGIFDFNPNIVFLNLHLKLICPEIIHDFASLTVESIQDSKEKVLSIIDDVVKQVLKSTDANVFLTNYIMPLFYHLGTADQKQEYGEYEFYMDLNLSILRKYKNNDRVQIIDINQLASSHGLNDAIDDRMYYLAKIPWSESFQSCMAMQVLRQIKAVIGDVKKCLVLDLDKTLWGGILGEVGPMGVQVGSDDPVSEAYYDFQKRIKAIKNRGVVLAICSKNNLSDVKEVFELRKDMPLKLSDFTVIKVNWEMKHINISQIADELNIGIDSVIFADDNPAECELIKQMLPSINTVQIPEEPSEIPYALDMIYGFDKVRLLSEDVVKATQYSDNIKRKNSEQSFGNLEDYLHSLGTNIEIREAVMSDVSRIHQLFTKTNQFNLTTIRYSQADIEKFIHDVDFNLYLIDARDKFGSFGKIGLVLVRILNESSVMIDSFILSCRAMGRGIESAIMNSIKKVYFEKNSYKVINAEFQPTKKNIPVNEFYVREGFSIISTKQESGKTEYLLLSDNYEIKKCDWINITD